MIVTQIPALLGEMYEDKNPIKTLLIDGVWGCGKTYNTKSFINENNHPNVIYISLFGLENTNDILFRLSEYLDSDYILNVNGKLSIRSPIDARPYNHALIVFDDLERINPKIELSSIYGVIDSLKNNGFKVVCIAYLKQLKEADEFKGKYKRFLEKTFDHRIHVSADISKFNEILNDKDITLNDSQIELFDGNWRTISKAYNHYKRINNCLLKLDKKDFLNIVGLDKASLFRCLVYAVMCVDSYDSQKPATDASNQFSQTIYEDMVERIGESETNKVYELFSKENVDLKDYVIAFVECIKNDDWEEYILSNYPQNEDTIADRYPFNVEPFFLSDEGKDDYFTSFFASLNDFVFKYPLQEKILNRFIGVFSPRLTKIDMDFIAKRINDSMSEEEIEKLIENMFAFVENPSDIVLYFKQCLIEMTDAKKSESTTNACINAYQKEDYHFLTDWLYRCKYGDKSGALRILKEHNYMIPDLSGVLDYDGWQYSHELASFVSGTDLQGEFVEHLKNLCNNNKSISLRERCNILVKQYHLSDFDFNILKANIVENAVNRKKQIKNKLLACFEKAVGKIASPTVCEISKTEKLFDLADALNGSGVLMGFDMFEGTCSGNFKFKKEDGSRLALSCVDLNDEEFIFKLKAAILIVFNVNDDTSPYLILESDCDREIRSKYSDSISTSLVSDKYEYHRAVFERETQETYHRNEDVDKLVAIYNDYQSTKNLIAKTYFIDRKVFAIVDFPELEGRINTARFEMSTRNYGLMDLKELLLKMLKD